MTGPLDLAQHVVDRLHEAGMTLAALPMRGTLPAGYRSGYPDIVRSIVTDYPPECACLRPAVPSAAAISRLDEVMGWVSDLPEHLRRIIGYRLQVHPIGGQYLRSMRWIGRTMGIMPTTVRNRHNVAIAMIAKKIAIQQKGTGHLVPKTTQITARSRSVAPEPQTPIRDAI